MDAIKRKKLRTVALFTGVSTLLGALVGFLFVAMGEPEYWPPRLGSAIGAAVGVGVGIIEEFVIPRTARTWGYHRLAATRLGLYGGWIAGLILLGNAVVNAADTGVSLVQGANDYLNEDIFLRDLAFAAGAATLAIAGLQLSKLYRVREIAQLLSGRYYSPEQEERVVLFVDIVGSSAIVERLGPVHASRFLRDCFADISEPTVAWGGHVYQHVGDGVVITWPDASEASILRGIECFFGIENTLEDRSGHYLASYQAKAEVRAGLHAGPLVATWVGEAKRELALHGEVLHVAARLQSRCRELGATCLVSADCVERTRLPEAFELRDVGALDLRGLQQGVRCYDVGRRATDFSA